MQINHIKNKLILSLTACAILLGLSNSSALAQPRKLKNAKINNFNFLDRNTASSYELNYYTNLASIQEYAQIPLKNAKLGEIRYLNFAQEPDAQLRRAFKQIESFEESLSFYQESGDYSYCYVKFDLNNDGLEDVFVTFNQSFASGSGGQHLWIFQKTNTGYKLVGNIVHTAFPSIIVTSSKTQGWNDLIRIPGKLFMWDDSYYESYRFNGKEYQLSGQLGQGVTLSGQVVLNNFSFENYSIWHSMFTE